MYTNKNIWSIFLGSLSSIFKNSLCFYVHIIIGKGVEKVKDSPLKEILFTIYRYMWLICILVSHIETDASKFIFNVFRALYSLIFICVQLKTILGSMSDRYRHHNKNNVPYINRLNYKFKFILYRILSRFFNIYIRLPSNHPN